MQGQRVKNALRLAEGISARPGRGKARLVLPVGRLLTSAS